MTGRRADGQTGGRGEGGGCARLYYVRLSTARLPCLFRVKQPETAGQGHRRGVGVAETLVNFRQEP